jgi:hypothetical protein
MDCFREYLVQLCCVADSMCADTHNVENNLSADAPSMRPACAYNCDHSTALIAFICELICT